MNTSNLSLGDKQVAAKLGERTAYWSTVLAEAGFRPGTVDVAWPSLPRGLLSELEVSGVDKWLEEIAYAVRGTARALGAPAEGWAAFRGARLVHDAGASSPAITSQDGTVMVEANLRSDGHAGISKLLASFLGAASTANGRTLQDAGVVGKLASRIAYWTEVAATDVGLSPGTISFDWSTFASGAIADLGGDALDRFMDETCYALKSIASDPAVREAFASCQGVVFANVKDLDATRYELRAGSLRVELDFARHPNASAAISKKALGEYLLATL